MTKDENWAEAMEGCKYVLSVASPVFFHKQKDGSGAIRRAVDGVLRVLRFAKEKGVKRVVMCSNFGSVGFTQTDKTRLTTEICFGLFKYFTQLSEPFATFSNRTNHPAISTGQAHRNS